MAVDEVTTLLARVLNKPLASEEAEVYMLLADLQHLPLAISQAGVYIWRIAMPVKKY